MSDEERAVLFCSDIGETGKPPSFLIGTSSMCRGSAVRYMLTPFGLNHLLKCAQLLRCRSNKLEQQSVMIDCDSNSSCVWLWCIENLGGIIAESDCRDSNQFSPKIN